MTYNPIESKWHNEHRLPKNATEDEREESIEKYKADFWQNEKLQKSIHELKGKILFCYCNPKSCHGEYLAELADNRDYFLAEKIKYEKKLDTEHSNE